jgi:hypothetical protein
MPVVKVLTGTLGAPLAPDHFVGLARRLLQREGVAVGGQAVNLVADGQAQETPGGAGSRPVSAKAFRKGQRIAATSGLIRA